MEWVQLFDYEVSTDWQYSNPVQGRDFKAEFIYVDINRNSLVLIALANLPPEGMTQSTEFFKPQQLRPLVESEIIRFAEPPDGWLYRIAVKKLQIPRQPITETQLRFYMPAYSSDPSVSTFNGATRVTDEHFIAVNYTNAVLLSAAESKKVGSTIINKSTSNLYISLGVPTTFTNYDKILSTNEVFETPFNWCGEIYGIWDQPDSAEINSNAKVKDFRFSSNVAL